MNSILILLIISYLAYDKRYDIIDTKDSILDFIDFKILKPIKQHVGQIHLFSNMPLQKFQYIDTSSFTASFNLSSLTTGGTFLAHNGITWAPTSLNISISDLTDDVEHVKLENNELKKKIFELEAKIDYLIDKEGET